MTKTDKKTWTSKSEWLEAALSLFEREGLGAVKIERMAKELKTSRSGFYWHFQDRNELLRDMLEYWRLEYTEVVIKDFKQHDMGAKEALYHVMQMINEHKLNRFEIHMRAWADNDPAVEKIVMEIYQERFVFIRQLFNSMGFTGCDLEMRARLWLCYATHGNSMFPEDTCAEGEDLIKIQHAILTD
jgi:AcrR family transcriptional regulator